jgi:alkylation response protein AidB-like acyl-CoA dehydrogenase
MTPPNAAVRSASVSSWNRLKSGERLSPPEASALATLALSPVTSGRPLPVLGGSAARVVVALLNGDLVAVGSDGPAGARVGNIADAAIAMIDFGAAGTERHVLASGAEAQALYQAALEEWRVLTAVALAGLGRRALELAAAYSVERVAYGVPIGSFQRIAHPMADAAINMDGAKLLAWRAIASIADGQERAGARVAMAYWWASHSVDQAVKHAMRTYSSVMTEKLLLTRILARANFLALTCGRLSRTFDTTVA